MMVYSSMVVCERTSHSAAATLRIWPGAAAIVRPASLMASRCFAVFAIHAY